MLRSKNISTLEIQGLAESFDYNITNSAIEINYVFIHRTVGNSENAEGCVRALPDITSGPEVRKIFKIRTFLKPDIFHPGHRTFKTLKDNNKKFQ